MNNRFLEPTERQLAHATPLGAPDELRDVVLGRVRRELAAERWDRRLGRAAVLLPALGVGLNLMLGIGAARADKEPIAGRLSQAALVDTAAAVAEATDFETGRLVARQFAALGGWSLDGEQMAALDAAVAKTLRGKSAVDAK